MHWDDDKDLVPSGFLNVDMKKSQHRLFNPTVQNVFTGIILYDVKCEGVNNKLSRRQIDVIEGNIASYSRCMNCSKRMEAMKDYNELDSTVVNMSAEKTQYNPSFNKEVSQ